MTPIFNSNRLRELLEYLDEISDYIGTCYDAMIKDDCSENKLLGKVADLQQFFARLIDHTVTENKIISTFTNKDKIFSDIRSEVIYRIFDHIVDQSLCLAEDHPNPDNCDSEYIATIENAALTVLAKYYEDRFQSLGTFKKPLPGSLFDTLFEHETITVPTRSEVEKLKSDWSSDPIWDIEDTEGFEFYKVELHLFREDQERKWKAEEDKMLSDLATIYDVSVPMVMKIESIDRRLSEILDTIENIKFDD